MALLVGAEVIHTSKASQTQLSNQALTAVDANVFHLQNICSSCAFQEGFADKMSAWAPAQAACWEFGDLGSTLGKAQPPRSLRERRAVGTGVDGDTDSLAGWDLLGRTQGHAGSCPCPPLSQLLPGSGRIWWDVRGAGSVRPSWGGQQEEPPLLQESTQVAKQKDGAGGSRSTSPALRACL